MNAFSILLAIGMLCIYQTLNHTVRAVKLTVRVVTVTV